jgi:hypothetical protein
MVRPEFRRGDWSWQPAATSSAQSRRSCSTSRFRVTQTAKENDKAPDYRIFFRCNRARGRVEEDLECRPQIFVGQARRSKLPGANLRLAGRGRKSRRICPHLVSPQRRLSRLGCGPPPFGRGARARVFSRPFAQNVQEREPTVGEITGAGDPARSRSARRSAAGLMTSIAES